MGNPGYQDPSYRWIKMNATIKSNGRVSLFGSFYMGSSECAGTVYVHWESDQDLKNGKGYWSNTCYQEVGIECLECTRE